MENKYISLFSGGMGLDIGLERAGFKCVLCNEIDALAVKTIKRNRPQIPVISESIELIDAKKIEDISGCKSKDIDLIAGGPPCQAFSVFGQRKGINDGRGRLIFEFQRIISEVRPKVFIMENVRGLHSMPLIPKGTTHAGALPEHYKAGSLLKELLKSFNEIGYRVDCYLVNSANYGAPQIRERLICIGNRFNVKSNFTLPEFSNRPSDNLPPFKTLGDVIGHGFKDPDPSILDFSPRKLKYLAMIPPGGNWRSMPVEIQKESMGKSWYLKGGRSAYWRRLSFEFPSPTVVTMPNHAGTSMCHPLELRALTVGEMAAIQEFPSNWIFEGAPSDKCKQIGNAVPPRLGEVAGNVAKKLLNEISECKLKSAPPSHDSKAEVVHLRPHVRTRTYFKSGIVPIDTTGYYSKPEKQQLLAL